MTSQRDALSATASSVQTRLLGLLDGMDYCLDWKADADAWSVRQIIYHLLDTPPGGLSGVLQGVVDGTIKEYDLWADRDNLTPERMEHELGQMQEDINRFFAGLSDTLSKCTDEDLLEKTVTVHMVSRGEDASRNGSELLERGFGFHWEDHLKQLQETRELLGFDA
jgi:hypothetical protein